MSSSRWLRATMYRKTVRGALLRAQVVVSFWRPAPKHWIPARTLPAILGRRARVPLSRSRSQRSLAIARAASRCDAGGNWTHVGTVVATGVLLVQHSAT
jgi:hypothetical protein